MQNRQRSRGVVLAVLAGAGAVIGPLLALAINVATNAQTRLPLGLDVIRKHPIGASTVLSIAGAALATLLVWSQARTGGAAETLSAIAIPEVIINEQGNHSGMSLRTRTLVSWPCQLGTLPSMAECFQVRDEVQAVIDAFEDGAAGTKCLILCGAGGVGKTQLATHYSQTRLRTGTVDLLLWVTAASREAITSDYARAMAAVGDADANDPEWAAKQFLAWLGTTDKRWLIVLDDLADPGDLKGLWPPHHATGRTLVTTRRQDAALGGPGRRRRDISVFTEDEAVEYVSSKLAAHGRQEPAEHCAALVEDLGYLPIAMSQAVAYLTDTGLDCMAYRKRWRDRRLTISKLVPNDRSLPDEQDRGLAAMWSLSVQRANDLPPQGLAGAMLELASELDSNGIPISVLSSQPAVDYLTTYRDPTPVTPSVDQGSASCELDGRDAADALHSLQRLSLATVDRESMYQLVRVHALLQRATRETLSAQRASDAIGAAAKALLSVWPHVERDSHLAQVLRANADRLQLNNHDAVWTSGAYPALFRAGVSLGEAGLLGAAIDYWQDLYDAACEHLGPLHPDTLSARFNLARYRGRAGNAAVAVDAFEKLLPDRVEALGPFHPDTLSTRHYLARYRGEAGDPGLARAGLARLLPDRARVLGPDHPDTLITRSSLALWEGEAGDAVGAADAFEQLLPDVQRVLGPDHPVTLDVRTHAIWWRGVAGDAAGAARGFERLLPDVVRVLGPDHPETLNTHNHLARWRDEAGDLEGAAADFQQVFAERLRVLGPDHPDTLNSRHSLAYLQCAFGDAAAAAASFERLLPDVERVLGRDHPDTMATRNHLACARGEAGNPERAVTEIDALLRDQLRVLGSDHPDTLHTRHSLAHWRGEAGDPVGAAREIEHLLADQLRILGPDHPETLATRAHLARYQGQSKSPHDAVAMLEELLSDRMRVLGPDHPHTLSTRHDLAWWRDSAGDRENAVIALTQLLTDELRVLGTKHPHVTATRRDLDLMQGRSRRHRQRQWRKQ